MGKRIWLPVGAKPSIYPTTERDELLNRLWAAQYAVPGAKTLEIQQLRDVVDYAEGRNAERDARENAKIQLGQEIVNQMPKDQVVGALKEFLAWKRRRASAT